MPWNDFFTRHVAPRFTDYRPRPEYSLHTGNNQDGYVYQLHDGINWRFSAEFPDERVNRAFNMAQQEFTDMNVEPWDRNTKTNKANIRIRKPDGNPITENDLNNLIPRLAQLMLALRDA